MQIICSLLFDTQEELNAWKSAFEAGISYALGDNEACIELLVTFDVWSLVVCSDIKLSANILYSCFCHKCRLVVMTSAH